MNDPPAIKIALMGPFGSGNLGDAATQDAMIATLRKRYPTAEIFGISVYPEDTEARHGIRSFPMHRSVRRTPQTAPEPPGLAPYRPTVASLAGLKAFVKRLAPLYFLLRLVKKLVGMVGTLLGELRFSIACHRTLKGIDVLLCSGGGQLDDHWGGPWVQPLSLFRWALVARLAGTRFGFISVGVGHLDAPMSRFLVRRALSWAEYRSFRDPQSSARVARLGADAAGPVFPDLAFSLPVPDRTAASDRGSGGQIATVGINVIPYCAPGGWPDSDLGRYSAYLEKIGQLVAWLARQGLRVMIFPTAETMDMRAVRDLEARHLCALSPDLKARVSIDALKGVGRLLQLLGECDLVIASRFHGVLLSFLMGTPAIGLSYHWKIDELMKECGQEARCFAIDSVTCETVQLAVEQLSKEREPAIEAIDHRIRSNQDQLADQYDRLFAFIAKAAQRRRGTA